MPDDHVNAPVAKAATAIAAAGLTWSELASVLAVIYTGLLICEWWWKKFWRPFLERRGWVKKRTVALTPSQWAALAERHDEDKEP